MDRLKMLLEENQWSRPSPSLLVTGTNKRVPTCPICFMPEKRGHDEECWLGQAIKLHEQEAQTTREQTSRIHGLKVNRDSLFEENKRFRSIVVTDVEIIKELNKTVSELRSELSGKMELLNKAKQNSQELKSELEGRMEQADEIIFQLNAKIATLTEIVTTHEKGIAGFRIEIIQQARNIYFWALMLDARQLAHSRNIDTKELIEPEAEVVATALALPVIVNERM